MLLLTEMEELPVFEQVRWYNEQGAFIVQIHGAFSSDKTMASFQTTFRAELISPTAFLAPGVVVIGDVTIHEEASVWFGAVVRGDVERVEIGARTNIQDLAVLHADPGFPCVLEEGVTVGHGAIVHGAVVEDNVMIGMRAVVMNGAHIGAGSIMGVGAVVTEGVRVPPRSIVLGMPGRVRRSAEDADMRRIERAAAHYVQAAQAYRKSP